jgi:hypothetical protein
MGRTLRRPAQSGILTILAPSEGMLRLLRENSIEPRSGGM